MSDSQSASTSAIAYQLVKAATYIKKAKNLLNELEKLNYKVLGDFYAIEQFIRDEVEKENEQR